MPLGTNLNVYVFYHFKYIGAYPLDMYSNIGNYVYFNINGLSRFEHDIYRLI